MLARTSALIQTSTARALQRSIEHPFRRDPRWPDECKSRMDRLRCAGAGVEYTERVSQRYMNSGDFGGDLEEDDD